VRRLVCRLARWILREELAQAFRDGYFRGWAQGATSTVAAMKSAIWSQHAMTDEGTKKELLH